MVIDEGLCNWCRQPECDCVCFKETDEYED